MGDIVYRCNVPLEEWLVSTETAFLFLLLQSFLFSFLNKADSHINWLRIVWMVLRNLQFVSIKPIALLISNSMESKYQDNIHTCIYLG